MEYHTKEDLDLFFELIKQLEQAEAEKRNIIGRQLAKLLRSDSVSIRRSAKYTLRKEFPLANVAGFSTYGPPEKAEIEFWESHFAS